jgi:hypothetical protein
MQNTLGYKNILGLRGSTPRIGLTYSGGMTEDCDRDEGIPSGRVRRFTSLDIVVMRGFLLR